VASGVLISDVVPGELTDLDYAYAGAEVSSIGSTDYTWQVADLAPDEGGRITITGVVNLSVSGTFSLTNQAEIASALVDWNVGDNTPQVSNTVDAESPVPPVLTGPVDGTLTDTNSLTLVWGASLDAAGYLLDWNGTALDVGDVTGHATGVLADGVYTWTVAAYDRLGNTSVYTDVWSFTVEATPPQILATAPEAGETDVALDAAVVITFSEPIAAGAFAYTVTPDPGGWSAVWSAGGSVVTLDRASFVPQTAYTVTIIAADDLAGNPLAGAPYAWSFSTSRYRVYLPLVAREYP
jgi:hypothetical protein